jgi:hypothetical protein
MNQNPSSDAQWSVLASHGAYRIERLYETARLAWADGDIIIGDHYGDPTSAVLSVCGGWCVTGGEGLVICRFASRLPSNPAAGTLDRPEIVELWRRRSPPPLGDKFWFVEGVWRYQGELIRALVDPLSEAAGLYEIDVLTLAWRKV